MRRKKMNKLYKYDLFIKEGAYEDEARDEKELVEKAIKMFADHFGLNLTKENIVNIQEMKNAND